MFAAGALVGYWITFYYADLLWVSGSASSLIAKLAIAPAGALVFGTVSALFVRRAGVFAVATAAGYFVLLLFWFVYADLFDIADREGGKGMAMIFLLGPIGGAMIGLIAAGLLGPPEVTKGDAAPSNG